ncbi:hypothetical protein NEAUS03_2043 [Nematocida ausubeli]|nr:hypothetical protein NEAUS03_2043 [Nematocida ausubeli]
MVNTNKTSENDEKKGPFLQKDAPVERVSPSDALSLMHGWRFVPDELELKKRMLYALAVGFECLSMWVYKQIIPYVDKYGGEDFESTIFPKLLSAQAQSKYTLTEIHQEIERNIVVLVKRMYPKHSEIFFTEDATEEAINEFRNDASQKDQDCIRVLYCFLQLFLTEIEELDVRTVELIFFLGKVLDCRIYDYLISYFSTEKDLLLEILVNKMKNRQMSMPEQRHLQDADIEKLFGTLEKITYTVKEEEDLAKKILLDLSKEMDVDPAVFFMIHALMFIKCKPDEIILEKIIDQMKNKNKAVRGQCTIILQAFSKYKGVTETLIKALEDADDDIKHQAKISLAVAIPQTVERQAELIDLYAKWIEEEECKYIEQLPYILIAAKNTNHQKHTDLYKAYCRIIQNTSVQMQVILLNKAVEIFSLYIKSEDLIMEEIKEMKIEDKKTGIEFPSPDLTENAEVHSYSADDAVSDLERLLMILAGQEGTVDETIKILPKISKLVTSSFPSRLLLSLYERDPKRNWRYWTCLLNTTESMKNILSGTNKEKILEHIKKLTKHWASAVRKAAHQTEILFA